MSHQRFATFPSLRRQGPLLARTIALALAVLTGAVLGACEGCQRSSSSKAPASPGAELGPSTLRLYMVTDVAGALEPCGCVKDQLGGLDHAGAAMGGGASQTGASALVAAGPLFFRDLENGPDARLQEIAKAETLATSLGKLGLLAFAPAENDRAEGETVFGRLAAATGAACVGECPKATDGKGDGFVLRTLNGVKVGVLGLARPGGDGPAPNGPPGEPPTARAKALAGQARAAGAQVLVALAPVGRGEAKRIAEAVPDLLAILVGSPAVHGELNTQSAPPERVGNVLVVELGNHLQSVGVLDLFVRDGSLAFVDGLGLDTAKKRDDVNRRIRDLRARLVDWEKDPRMRPKDMEDRKRDLALLEAERASLERTPPPPKGSFYRYATVDVRAELGTDGTIHQALLAYYARVNEENKKAFAGRLPSPVPPGQSSFVGAEVCGSCHAPALAVWKATAHAGAYATLAKEHKEYNLDCVSCHVTGYGLPGGSTVTHVDKLQDVQCEVCHGPGSRHVQAGGNKLLIVGRPGLDVCTSCHHPPHVNTFDPQTKVELVLGPGHGRPLKPKP